MSSTISLLHYKKHHSRSGLLFLACAAFSCALCLLFFFSSFRYHLVFDEWNYFEMGKHIAQFGPFSKYPDADTRPFAYPWFLGFIIWLSGLVRANERIMIFISQLSLFLGAVSFLRRSLQPHSNVLANAVSIGLLLNIFVIVYIPEILTESLSICLLIFVVSCLIRAAFLHYRQSGLAWFCIGSVLIGILVVVRLSNLYLLPAWLTSNAVIALFGCNTRFRAILMAMFFGLGSAFLPLCVQTAITYKNYGTFTPPLANDLARYQMTLGPQVLKYASGWPDAMGETAIYNNPRFLGSPPIRIFYENPFYTYSSDEPISWYLAHPTATVKTFVAKSFALIDHDLLYTFSPNTAPSYRWALSLVNHFAIGLFVVALIFLPTLMRSLCGVSKTTICMIYVTIFIFFVCHLGFYLPTIIEVRFGLPLIAVIGSLSALGVVQFGSMHLSRLMFMLVALSGYTYIGYKISEWERDQAPVIVRHKNRREGVECGGFRQYMRDLTNAFLRTAPGVSSDYLIHEMAEPIIFMVRNTKRGRPLLFSTTVFGQALNEYIKRNWRDISVEFVVDAMTAVDEADLLFVPYLYRNKWPERYPCIDGRRAPTEFPNEEESYVLKLKALSGGWHKWASVEGPYFGLEILVAPTSVASHK